MSIDRQGMNAREGFKIIIFTLTVSVLLTLVLLGAFASSFPDAVTAFFVKPLTNRYFFGNLLAAAIPLMIAGLGIAFAFSSSNFNLGGEGQIYAGALAAVLAARAGGTNQLAIQMLALLAASMTGAVLGGLSGLLKRYLRVDELLSSFLISGITVYSVDFFIAGPLRDTSSNFMTTAAIPANSAFQKIYPPSNLSTALFLALAAVIAGKFIMDRTRIGFELKIAGANREFAQYAGIGASASTILPMVLSGALHGLAGGILIFGTYFKAMRGFSAGIGWSAIAVSLIAKNNPLGLIPAAFFYAYLEAGSKSVMLGANISSEIVLIIQSAVLILITATRVPLARLFSGRNKHKKEGKR